MCESTQRRWRAAVGVFAAATVAALAACGADRVGAAEGRRYVEEVYAARAAGASFGPGWYRTLDELVPNVVYERENGQRSKGATHVVVGRIVDVEKGKGFRIEGDDAPDGITTDFDDPRARWWTVHATVTVERGLASEAPRQLRAMFPSGGPKDFARLSAGLPALGRVVLFMRRDDPLTAYDPDLYWVMEEDGLLVATVGPDGRLDLPLMPDERAAELLRGVRRFSDLESKSRNPRTIRMTGSDPNDQRRADGK